MTRALVALVVLGAILDVGVFTFQTVQYGQINTNTAKSKCWDGVLDDAISHPPKTLAARDELVKQATVCTKIP